ncbi:FecR family protein [Mucilaginibacter jinjuensis]|uniref:FecR domain-containing protein n=1 Tax=Mucilaginibacter jinjuensis TaxID=1176721 RepID=A0ABY7T4E8_9SPHI|nr:FecR family protein [Mucilaginibacter jinjuensis]WCT10658.1 FecR domain-containing protein [Mucilaginibacter jinjuensis]
MKNPKYTQLKQLFSKYEQGQIDDHEKKLVDDWFQNYEDGPDAEILNDPDTEKRIYQELNLRLTQGISNSRVRELWTSTVWFKAACSIGVLFTIAGIFYRKQGLHVTIKQSYQTIITANAQVKKIKLDDSTEVWLNAATTVRIPLIKQDKKRIVYLDKGEAFFKVKHDTARPFSVVSGNLVTRDIGTSFNIRAYDLTKQYQVSVASGRVDVGIRDQHGNFHLIRSAMERGDVLNYNTATGKPESNKKQAELISTWRTPGSFDLETMTLAQIGDELARHFNVSVKVNHPQFDPTAYTFHLANQNLHQVLQRLTLTTGMSYSLDNNHLIINAPDKRMK